MYKQIKKDLKLIKKEVNIKTYKKYKSLLTSDAKTTKLNKVKKYINEIHQMKTIKNELKSYNLDTRTIRSLNRITTLKGAQKMYNAENSEVSFYRYVVADIKKENGFILKVPFNLQIRANKRTAQNEIDMYFENELFNKISEYNNGLEGEIKNNTSTTISADMNFDINEIGINHVDPLKLFTLEKFTNDQVKYDNNCFINYIHNELLNHKPRKYDIKQFNERLNEIKYDKTYGMTIAEFEKIMQYYPYISYTGLSPSFEIITDFTSTDYDNNPFRLCFYINNGHLYPITDNKLKKLIQDNKHNISNFMINKVFNNVLPTVYKYLDNASYTQEFKSDSLIGYIINKSMNLNTLFLTLTEKTGYGVENPYIYVNNKNGTLTSFRHPTEPNIYFFEYNDYIERENAYNKLNIKYNNLFGTFANQQWSTIGQELLTFYGGVPSSNYNKEAHSQLNKYETKAIQDATATITNDNEYDESTYKIHVIDAYKQFSTICYTYLQSDNQYIPIYDVHNRILPYDNSQITIGEYYIEELKYKNIKMFGCFVHYGVVSSLLTKNIINKSNIKYMINTLHYYKPEVLKRVIETTATLGEYEFKNINNKLIGSLNNKFYKSSKSFFTNDITTVMYYIHTAITDNKQFNWSKIENKEYYFIKHSTKNPRYENTSSIYRSVISMSIFQIICLMDTIKSPILKVQTDAVYYIPESKDDIKNFKPIENDILTNLGRFKSNLISSIKKMNKYIPPYEPYILEKKDSLILGAGGCGKSYTIIQEQNKNDNILYLSTTNNAVLELKQKSLEIHNNIPDNWHFSTFALFFINIDIKTKNKIESYDKIIIDECFMTNNKYMRILKQIKTPIIYLGDNNQLHPIYNGEQPTNDPLNDMFYDCNIIYKEYNEKYARYNKKSFNIFNKFNITGDGTILNKLSNYNDKHIYNFYLCSENATRQKYTKIATDHFCKDGAIFDFKYNKNIESYKIINNMPIICTENNKELKQHAIFNNWKGTLIINNGYFIKGVMNKNDNWEDIELSIDEETLKNYFLPLYVSTIHKYQGGVIKGDYVILDTEKFLCDRNSLYTSITRTTNYKHIHVDKMKILKTYNKTSYSSTDITPKQLNYNIYEVIYNDEIIKFCHTSEIKKIDYNILYKYINPLTNNKKTTKTPYELNILIKDIKMNKQMKNTILVPKKIKEIKHDIIVSSFKNNNNNFKYEPKYYIQDTDTRQRIRIVYYDDTFTKQTKDININKNKEITKQKVNKFLESNKICLSFNW